MMRFLGRVQNLTIHLFIMTLENGRDYDHDVGNH